MKDSGVEWIGEIPINAKIIKLKSISNIINGYAFKSEMFTDDENELNVITISSFDNQKILPEKLSYSIEKKDFSKYLLQENDILIAMSGGTVGKNVLVRNIRKNMYINQRVCILRSQYYKYISYWINSDSFKEYTLLNSIGSAQPNISSTQLNEFDIPWSNEVEKVVDILDEKISIIEDIIVKTKNSIEELKKYKQSLITEVVTKGLDKNVEMKDSGIEWIGEIPKDWGIRKMKNLGRIINGLTFDPSDVTDEQNGILLLRSGNIQNGKLDFQNNIYIKKSAIDEKKIVNEDDILICSRNGSRNLIGKNAIITENVYATFGAFMMLFKTDKYNSRYLYYILNSGVFNYYLGTFLTSTINQLTKNNFDNMQIVFTEDILEQRKIVKYLDNKVKLIDELINNKSKIINEYKSYKKSLIYEYVTGKKEVGEEEK